MIELEQAAKIQKCRKTARFLMGDSYLDEIEPYKNMIKQRCKVLKTKNPLEAVADISSKPKIKQSTCVIIYLLAAAAEIIEPEKT